MKKFIATEILILGTTFLLLLAFSFCLDYPVSGRNAGFIIGAYFVLQFCRLMYWAFQTIRRN